MRRNAWIFVILLGICTRAEAQTTPQYPKVEVGATVGILSARPGGGLENEDPYMDDWYGSGRYAGSISYYWTRHLKTEFEHQWSNEGWLNYMSYARINGAQYSTHAMTFHQLQQSSLKMVWQFGDNAWVHPSAAARWWTSSAGTLKSSRTTSFAAGSPGARRINTGGGRTRPAPRSAAA
jgi:hypothetical protein